MSLRLFNTATREKEEFSKEGIVTAYTCGLTVYDNPHIGNWRTFIFYDTLMRTLRHSGYDVHDIQNITDVGHLVGDEDDGEDKLAKQAKSQKRSAWDVAAEYTDILLKGMSELNIHVPYKMPKATDHIPAQIALIKTLEEKGYTYQIDDGVYFDTSKFPDYGKTLLGKNAKADTDFARIGENIQKRNPEDFALWKTSPEGVVRDMEWESPWGTGFPGWHIECSAMAKQYLGDTIDIHAGGIDHIPVHHTNEIAQSEAANEAQFARFWLHGEFIQVDGKKMSKSLGNVYTLDDIRDKGFTPLDFRMLVVKGHYRTETNFTWKILEEAKQELSSIRSKLEVVFTKVEHTKDISTDIDKLREDFIDAMDNDLGTPQALSYLHSALSLGSGGLHDKAKKSLLELVQTADAFLGLELMDHLEDIPNEVKDLINKRAELLSKKNPESYAKADKLRDLLKSEHCINIQDGPNGQIWMRDRS